MAQTKHRVFYKNGKVKTIISKLNYKNDGPAQHGVYKELYENGNLKRSAYFKKIPKTGTTVSHVHGVDSRYDKEGNIASKVSVVNGEWVGWRVEYSDAGAITRSTYRNKKGSLVSSLAYTTQTVMCYKDRLKLIKIFNTLSSTMPNKVEVEDLLIDSALKIGVSKKMACALLAELVK